MICSCESHRCNCLFCQHSAYVLKYHYAACSGYSKYYVSIFWWTEKLYFTSTNENDDNIDKVYYYPEDISNSDSKVIYINDIVDANMKGVNYKFGNTPRVSFQGDTSLWFKYHPMKYARICVNYMKYQIKEILSQYNDVIFGMYQASNPNSSYYDDFYYNTITMEYSI